MSEQKRGAARSLIGSQLIATVDTIPFSTEMSEQICSIFKAERFGVEDNGHHISVDTPGAVDHWECAIVYLEGQTLWVRVLARRWWLLFSLGDKDNRYVAIWAAVDRLEPLFETFRAAGGTVMDGTVGELSLKQAFRDTNGRSPTAKEQAGLESVTNRLQDRL